MKRLLIVVVIALAAGACSGGGDVAATVNGADIEVSTVEGLVASTDEEMPDDQFLNALTAVVQWTAIADAAEADFEIEPTDDEVAAYADEIFAAQGAGMTREEFLETQQVSEEGFSLYASQLLIGEQVLEELQSQVEEPTAEEAQQLLIDDPKSWTLVCSSHILVATAEEATDVQARLEDGEDFAAIAVELSLDTGSGASGGDLGCTAPVQYVDEFADATMTGEIGEVVGPVETQFGFHLIRTDSRTEATTEELQQALAEIRLSELLETWYLDAVVGAEITVAPEYGTWETDPVPTIVPPVS